MKFLRDIIDPGDLIPDNATNGDIIKALFPDSPRVHKIIQDNFYTWWRTEFRGNGMTREEASEILLDMANELQLIPESKQGQAFKMALKSLDNEKVLDKISTEIETKSCITVGPENDPAITLYDVLHIIDKYRVENEENNDR